MLVGNIYVAPNNEEQLHTLEKVLESLKNETIILLGDFNALMLQIEDTNNSCPSTIPHFKTKQKY